MLSAAAIQEKIAAIKQQMSALAPAGAAAATLIAVTKTFPAAAIRAAYTAGVRDIGENYLQEAEEKIAACADLPLVWHFIGRLQKNKLARIARQFDWVHSVDRLSFARRLAEEAGTVRRLNVLLQVNISGEAGKAGVAAADAPLLARQVAALPNLCLRGLMILPAAETDIARQQAVFQRTAALQRDIVAATGLPLDCLSMGMSGDYAAALAAGATHIRLGSALFGARSYPTDTDKGEH